MFKTNKRLSYADIAEVFGLKRETLGYRLRNGMGFKEALETPINSYIKDLTGQQFGRLTAMYVIQGTHDNGRKWHCICTCGNECDVEQNNLTYGRQLSCGCLNDERRREKHKDMSNEIIHGIKLLHRTEDEIDSNGISHIHYLCVCPFCDEEFDAR